MKKILIIMCLIALCGCGMTNDEIIEENNKCKSAGLESVQTANELGVIRVICIVKTQDGGVK